MDIKHLISKYEHTAADNLAAFRYHRGNGNHYRAAKSRAKSIMATQVACDLKWLAQGESVDHEPMTVCKQCGHDQDKCACVVCAAELDVDRFGNERFEVNWEISPPCWAHRSCKLNPKP